MLLSKRLFGVSKVTQATKNKNVLFLHHLKSHYRKIASGISKGQHNNTIKRKIST